MWKKNLEVMAQKEYYEYPKKSVFKIIIGIIGLIVLWYCLQVFPTVFSTVIIRIKGLEISSNMSYIMPAVGNFLAAFVVWFFFLRKEKKCFPLVTKKMTKLQCASGAFFCLAISGVISLIVDLIKHYTGIIQTDAGVAGLMEASLPMQILMSVISASIAEEILLRGCIQNRLMCRINNVWALIITAVIFGIVHLNISQLITASVTGFGFCFVYAKTRSLWAAIFAHMVNNFTGSLLSHFPVGNPDKPAFWIVNAVIIAASVVLCIPFLKADAATIEQSEAKV